MSKTQIESGFCKARFIPYNRNVIKELVYDPEALLRWKEAENRKGNIKTIGIRKEKNETEKKERAKKTNCSRCSPIHPVFSKRISGVLG